MTPAPITIKLTLLRRLVIFLSQVSFSIGNAFFAIGHRIFWLGMAKERQALASAIADALDEAALTPSVGSGLTLVQPQPKDVQ